jgi:hypothetical protein
MQKICIISCCAECPAYKMRVDRLPQCKRQGWLIEGNSDNPVNLEMVGFPEWCPLEAVETVMNGNYQKEVNQIMRIMEDDANQDALLDASLYLNRIVEDAKKKAEIN